MISGSPTRTTMLAVTIPYTVLPSPPHRHFKKSQMTSQESYTLVPERHHVQDAEDKGSFVGNAEGLTKALIRRPPSIQCRARDNGE